ncbi:MAG: circadian clock KaiB family protein [Spirochaetia bacterium]
MKKELHTPRKGKIYLQIYVIGGENIRSKRNILRLQEIMESNFRDSYELVVIDLLLSPELGEEDRIMVAPTVVKKAPPPIQKIIGSLADEERVLTALDLNP